VFVNDKKFACESCIKGHRSSSCHHTERPLFEIKKKGRPVSQCEKCRELRKTKRVHSKCVCSPTEKEDKKEDLKQLSSKCAFIWSISCYCRAWFLINQRSCNHYLLYSETLYPNPSYASERVERRFEEACS
ncbi:copper fist DNA binding domain-containing protein, partial [Irpex rosettiformis]